MKDAQPHSLTFINRLQQSFFPIAKISSQMIVLK